jgi:hypothetical protein
LMPCFNGSCGVGTTIKRNRDNCDTKVVNHSSVVAIFMEYSGPSP